MTTKQRIEKAARLRKAADDILRKLQALRADEADGGREAEELNYSIAEAKDAASALSGVLYDVEGAALRLDARERSIKAADVLGSVR